MSHVNDWTRYCIFQADSLLNWLVGWIRLVIFTFSLFIFATSVVSLNRLALGNEELTLFNTTIAGEKNENATLQYFVVDATDAPYEYEYFWYGWRLAFDLIISGLICLDSVIVLVNKLGTRWRRLVSAFAELGTRSANELFDNRAKEACASDFTRTFQSPRWNTWRAGPVSLTKFFDCSCTCSSPVHTRARTTPRRCCTFLP